MLYALDLTHHLFGRRGNHTFHFSGTGSRQRHHDVGHGDINLGFLFFWCDDHRQDTEDDRQNGQQRGQVIVLKGPGNDTGRANRGQFLTHGRLLPACR